jgi:hypothetical protein
MLSADGRSAFGVEHGEVSKAFRRLGPQLRATLKDSKGVNMDERARHNYAMFRQVAGNLGRGSRGKPDQAAIELQRQFKGAAHASVTAAGNISRRKGRYLP